MRCLNCHQQDIPPETENCPNCGVHLPSLLQDVLPSGTTLRSDTYQIQHALGRGGFGITYSARHPILEQLVAIKEFYPKEHSVRHNTTGSLSIPSNQQENYQRGKERFIKEGRILAKLNHPNVLRVQDLFEERNTAYLVMELISGNNLKQELQAQLKGKLPIKRVEQLMTQLVGALAAVHQAGIYHLDLKPENILLTSVGKLIAN